MAKQPRLFPMNDPGLFPYTGKGHFDAPHARKRQWLENAYVEGASALEQSHDYVGTSLTRRMYIFVVIVVMSVFLVLYGRVAWLQVMQGSSFASVAESNRTRHIAVAAERGVIYDRNGVPLTKNLPRFSLYIAPRSLPEGDEDRESLANTISSILQRPYDEVLTDVQTLSISSDREVLLYENVSQKEAIALSVTASTMPALHVVSGIKRSYEVFDDPIESISHVVGYEGKISEREYQDRSEQGYAKTDYIGKQGVEVRYEDVLRGVKGDRVVEVNSRGLSLGILSEESPVQGHDVTLTLDSNLQRAAEEALVKGLGLNDKDRGVVVVQAVHTGEILAMVSMPGFSHEAFARGLSVDEYQSILDDERRPLINRAVAGLYPSGSIIKPVMALGALSEGVISDRTTIVSTGGISVGPWFFPDWKAGGHGRVDVKEAIAHSVNTFFYIIGGGYEEQEGLGVTRINKWLTAFGFGQSSGVDLLSEKIGLIPDPQWKKDVKNEEWYVGDTYNLSIGQGDLLITPLQITNAISAIANGGKLYQPHVVKRISDEEAPISYSQIDAPDEAFRIVQDGMRDTVVYGSARSMSVLPIMVAGKTGTAQWSSINEPHAWFVGFAPYKNPQIAVTVLVEEGEEGSRVAVPIARDIFEWWARHSYRLD